MRTFFSAPRNLSLLFAAASVTALVTGCSSSDSNGTTPTTSPTTDGGTGIGTGTTDGSTGGGSTSTGSTLNGAYDLSSTANGGTVTGSLTISSAGFTIVLGDDTLSYVATAGQMSASWTADGDQAIPITTARTASAGDVNGGIVPLDFGGDWTFTTQGAPGATLNFAPGMLSVSGQADLPDPIPNLESGATYTGTRGAAQTSVFGDFGGVWTLKSNSTTGSDPGCTASFVGSTFTWSCASAESDLDGTMSLTFSSDLKTATGTTGAGAELSAQLH